MFVIVCVLLYGGGLDGSVLHNADNFQALYSCVQQCVDCPLQYATHTRF
jgi:hypothetical protein